MRCVVLLAVVLGGCGPHAAAPTRRADAEIEEGARRTPWVVSRNEVVSAVARDETHVYWADLLGIHRRPLGGPDEGDAQRIYDGPDGWPGVSDLAVAGGRVVFSDGLSVLEVPVDGGRVTTLVENLDERFAALAARGDDVVVATMTSILRLTRGGAPKVIAKGQTNVIDVVIEGDQVYWLDYGEEQPASITPAGGYYPPEYGATSGPGALRRAPLAGGPVHELAASLPGPAELAIRGGRVWWVSERGGGLSSIPIGGGEVRRATEGPFVSLAIDDAGTVLQHVNGFVLERRGAGPATLRMASDGAWSVVRRDMALTPDWVYVIATRPADGTHALIALPRQREAASVLATTRWRVTRVRAHDGHVVWVEEDHERGGVVIRRADGRTGKTRELAHRPSAYVMDLAWNGGEVYFAEEMTIYQVPRGGGEPTVFATSDSNYISALTVHRKHVYWLDGTALVGKRRKGGHPQIIARSPTGYTRGEAGMDLVFDDEYAYLTLFDGTESLFRISERGRVEKLWDAMSGGIYVAQDLVKLGDDLFLYAAQTIYRRVPDETPTTLWTARGQRYIYEIAGGAGLLYAIVVDDGGVVELVRIDPSNGEGRTVLRWSGYGSERGALTVDDVAAYMAVDTLGGVIRVKHDAPAAVEIGAAAAP